MLNDSEIIFDQSTLYSKEQKKIKLKKIKEPLITGFWFLYSEDFLNF